MEQIVNQMISAGTVPESCRKELLKSFQLLSDTAKEIGINSNDLWRAYLAKVAYNQYDNREKRHIMYANNEEKNRVIEQEKSELRKRYSIVDSTTKVNGYDVATQQIRPINRETEYALAFFQDETMLNTLSTLVPPYIKYKVLKCSNLFIVDIPNQCINYFAGLFILLAPKKKTVMIGIDGYSPTVDVAVYNINSLRIAFLDADKAEQIDDTYSNKFWFFENYSTKRKYHFIYSNSKQ